MVCLLVCLGFGVVLAHQRVVYGLGPYIADYPEQALAGGIVQGWCPKCLKPRNKLGENTDDLFRCREHTDEVVAHLDPRVLWSDYGIIANITVSVLDSFE